MIVAGWTGDTDTDTDTDTDHTIPTYTTPATYVLCTCIECGGTFLGKSGDDYCGCGDVDCTCSASLACHCTCGDD